MRLENECDWLLEHGNIVIVYAQEDLAWNRWRGQQIREDMAQARKYLADIHAKRVLDYDALFIRNTRARVRDGNLLRIAMAQAVCAVADYIYFCNGCYREDMLCRAILNCAALWDIPHCIGMREGRQESGWGAWQENWTA